MRNLVMKFSLQTSIAAVVLAVAVVVFATLFIVKNDRGGESLPGAEQATTSGEVVRESSHRLDTADDGKVTLVEFLDFECEACGALYPAIEELREKYAGRITFVARYFPVPSHRNALNAALAVQAASQQGKFEAMYQRMYETQDQWGEKQNSEARRFRTFAQDLDLDMAKYDADIASEKTQNRVALDQRDGIALGVTGTPSLFLNGKKLEVSSEKELHDAVDKALRG